MSKIHAREALLMILVFSTDLARSHALGQERPFPDTDAAAGWAEYELFSRSLQGTLSQVHTYSLDGKTHRKSALTTVKQNEACAILHQFGEDDRQSFLLIENPLYTAQLIASPKNPKTWVLKSYRPGADGRLQPKDEPIADQVFWCTSPHLTFAYVRLSSLFATKSFNIRKMVRNQHDEIRVDYTHATDDPSGRLVREGTMVLARKRIWYISAIDERFIQYRAGRRHSTTNWKRAQVVTSHTSGFPLAVSWNDDYQTVYDAGNRKVKGRREWKLDDLISDYRPEHEFRLSYFGLPEPFGGAQRPPTRWFLWLSLVGAGCVVVGLWRRKCAKAAHAGRPSDA